MKENFGSWKVSCKTEEKSPTVQFQYLGYADEVFSEVEKYLGKKYSVIKFEKIESNEEQNNVDEAFQLVLQGITNELRLNDYCLSYGRKDDKPIYYLCVKDKTNTKELLNLKLSVLLD